jgi:NAD(P)-dependent dehydrogenase (short-subunit alcohol dehydrogenase family)
LGGRVAVVTGAGRRRGIGAAICRRSPRRGRLYRSKNTKYHELRFHAQLGAGVRNVRLVKMEAKAQTLFAPVQ